MSLFRVRDWWSTVAGDAEEYDQGCLCVSNIDNSSNGLDKVLVGSFHGILRIYFPRPSKGEHGWSGFRPEDLMLEQQLGAPIIQMEAGRFVSASESLHLAVLHPRKLSVYTVQAVSGAVEHGNFYQIKVVYEHNLQRTACNFCYGSFGGVKGKDFICLQSMDATVSVFEQESFAFSRFLPGALLPGPLRYVAKSDSFVTVSSSRQVESYKYQVLAVATDAKTKEESQSIKSGKKVAIDWTFNLGECALDIKVVNYNNAPLSIFILGERNLFCLTESGRLRFMKKLDYNPSCFLPYACVQEGMVNYLVGTHTGNMMVYQDATLKWASHMQHVPVQVRIGNFQELKGVVVSLDDEGHLTCSYMGTDPALFTPPKTESRDINFEEQDEEMRLLQRAIKESSGATVALPSKSSSDDVEIVVTNPTSLDREPRGNGIEFQDEDPIPSVTAQVELHCKSSADNVKVTVHVKPPLSVNQSTFTLSVVDSTRPQYLEVVFFMKNDFLPCDLGAQITATYQNSAGAPRIVQAEIQLPLKLVVKPCMPSKTANYKITIDTNKPPQNLNDLFPDLLGDNAGGPGSALGFQYFGGPVVTMLASKSAQRYRLQSDSFAAMWLLTQDLCRRLAATFQRTRQTDFQASFTGQIPLHEFFEVVDTHFELRMNDAKFKELLAQRATQFRVIQRRLLARFKDKTPSPLNNLDTLLDGTYRQNLALGDAVEENKRSLERASCNVSAAVYLLNHLIKLWLQLSPAEFRILEGAISPIITDSIEHGWEEAVDAAVTHLLRTCLSKNSKDQTVNPSPLGIPRDTTKMKKHIAMMCDRLGKGAKLVMEGVAPQGETAGDTKENKSTKSPRPAPAAKMAEEPPDASPTELGEAEVPLGSKFGEKKSPRALAPLNGQSRGLPPLAGPGGGLAPIGRGLPPLKSNRSDQGVKSAEVPDLDKMDSGDGEEPMINGLGEKVYSL